MNTSAMRIAVLASGRGSNLQALIAAIADGRLPATIAGVFSDKPQCAALQIAHDAGLHVASHSPRDHADRDAHDEALFGAVAAVQPDLIVCAGYLRIIGARALHRFENRMLNIHPSLLPKYPGLHTHAKALAAGDAVHGASVHSVIPALDAGPVLAQASIDVRPGDDADALAARLLPREHALLVASVALVANGRIELHSDHVVLDGVRLAAPLQLDADNRLTGA
jgi:phosphoribosylglycinamide formyltransferase-1